MTSGDESLEKDFSRDVWCILGIPFDNYSMEDVCNVMDDRIAQENQCVLSTPNLDWVSMSLRDCDFKKTIIDSDVSIIDGTPSFGYRVSWACL
jgi:N-acetylglucosaminyldiphosphoundecaprenol N-acetyl-beta-D-mannosaminyltransferase